MAQFTRLSRKPVTRKNYSKARE